MESPAPTEKLAPSSKIKLRSGGVPANLVPMAYRPPVMLPAARTRTGDRSISAGWWLLIAGFVLACIPMFGFFIYIAGVFLCLAAFILAIIGMAHGRTWGGIFLLSATLVAAPVAYLIAPWLSTSIFGQAAERSGVRSPDNPSPKPPYPPNKPE